MLLTFLQGFFMGASLIIAIGVQNAFVLRQGIKQRHVFATVMTAALCDVVLIAAGILGFGVLVEEFPSLITVVTWGGAAFLIAYALKSFYSAYDGLRSPQSLDQKTTQGMVDGKPVQRTVLLILALSLLNPHVYLDTVILLGGISASFEGDGRYVFGFGAILASLCWFFALGYGARFLAPLFEKPKSWQILDILIGLVMIAIAAKLIL